VASSEPLIVNRLFFWTSGSYKTVRDYSYFKSYNEDSLGTLHKAVNT